MAQLQVHGLVFSLNLKPTQSISLSVCMFLSLNIHVYNRHLSVNCGNHTFPGSLVQGINEIQISIRQPHFNVEKGLSNE